MSSPDVTRGVLIVDDNPTNLRLAEFLLTRAGFEVRTARDAQETRATLASFAPSIILMDLQLPGIDGFTLTRELKSTDTTRDICIIAMTAYAMSGDADRARAAGCDGYVAKPVDPRALVATVRRHLAEHPCGARLKA